MPYAKWLPANAPTYLQDEFGQAWMGGIGAAMDDYVQQYIAGAGAAFPDFAPPDALGVIGDELGIDRGPAETSASYAARLVGAWTAWKLAGTPVGLLAALYWAGFPGAVILQQNGRAYSLSGALTPGSDPTAMLVVQSTSVIGVLLTSSVTPPTVTSVGRSIPAGNSWVGFSSDTDFCSRFIVAFPGGLERAVVFTSAVFTGVEDGVTVPWPTATWPNPLSMHVGYNVIAGPPKVTSGGPVVCSAASSTKSSAGIMVQSTGSFVGTVDLKAVIGVDSDLLKSVILKWKPAKAVCLGAYEYQTTAGAQGWPIRNMGDGTLMGAMSVNTLVAGSF